MRNLILNLHLYTALVAGLFVITLGVTGSIMAFEEDIDRTMNPGLFKVEPAGQPMPVAAILASVKKAYPDARLNSIHITSRPDESYTSGSRAGQFFINQYTGQVVGVRKGQTTLQKIHQLHLNLLMGKSGRTVVLIVALVLIWLVGSGIYLWWPLKRSTVKFGGSMRRITFDLHNAVGIYTAAFLLTLAVTGVVVHYDDDIGQWLNNATHSKAPVRTVPSVVQPGVKPITPEQAMESAKAALPGASPLIVSIPQGPKGSYNIPMHFPEDLTPGGRSWVVVDQYSAKPLFIENSRTAVPGTKTIIENRAIHTGDILGYPTKILMSLSSLMLVLQTITGYYMWWKRLRVRSRQAESARVSESVA